jgi:hypothetical protein
MLGEERVAAWRPVMPAVLAKALPPRRYADTPITVEVWVNHPTPHPTVGVGMVDFSS